MTPGEVWIVIALIGYVVFYWATTPERDEREW
jgi:nitrogen fixation-related uncharacterized protein